MGFSTCELTVLGHMHRTRPIERPAGRALRALADRARRGRGGLKLWAQETRPGTDAAQTWSSALPVSWHNSTWIADRAISWLTRAPQARRSVLRVGILSRSRIMHSIARAVELALRPEDMPLPANRVRDLERRPWWHKAVLEGAPQLADPALLKFRTEGSRVPDRATGSSPR
jgi:hypothetical protein